MIPWKWSHTGMLILVAKIPFPWIWWTSLVSPCLFVTLLMLCTLFFDMNWPLFCAKRTPGWNPGQKSKPPCSHMHHLWINPDKTWITIQVCNRMEGFHNNGFFLSEISKLAKFSRYLICSCFFGRPSGTETFEFTFTPTWFTKWAWLYYMADRNPVLTL